MKATYHKSRPRYSVYPECPKCDSKRFTNYIGQVQRGMRSFTCARCIHAFFTWGPKMKYPRPLRDGKGKRILFHVDEMGEGND